jgi:hypothetical protein
MKKAIVSLMVCMTFFSCLLGDTYQNGDSMEDTEAYVVMADTRLTSLVEFASVGPSDIVRIEGPVSAGWRSEQNCCTADTAREKIEQAVEEWVAIQWKKNSNMKVMRYGHNGWKAQCKIYEKTFFNYKRSYGGLVRATAFVEFVKK